MANGGGGGGGGPDWVVIGGVLTTVLGALGAVIAGMRGAFRQKTTDADKRQQTRDASATANADQTLESIWRLVNELQEERTRLSLEIERLYHVCQEAKSALGQKVGELEAEIRKLEAEIRVLKRKQPFRE